MISEKIVTRSANVQHFNLQIHITISLLSPLSFSHMRKRENIYRAVQKVWAAIMRYPFEWAGRCLEEKKARWRGKSPRWQGKHDDDEPKLFSGRQIAHGPKTAAFSLSAQKVSSRMAHNTSQGPQQEAAHFWLSSAHRLKLKSGPVHAHAHYSTGLADARGRRNRFFPRCPGSPSGRLRPRRRRATPRRNPTRPTPPPPRRNAWPSATRCSRSTASPRSSRRSAASALVAARQRMAAVTVTLRLRPPPYSTGSSPPSSPRTPPRSSPAAPSRRSRPHSPPGTR